MDNNSSISEEVSQIGQAAKSGLHLGKSAVKGSAKVAKVGGKTAVKLSKAVIKAIIKIVTAEIGRAHV